MNGQNTIPITFSELSNDTQKTDNVLENENRTQWRLMIINYLLTHSLTYLLTYLLT